jgi:hypothetical protein
MQKATVKRSRATVGLPYARQLISNSESAQMCKQEAGDVDPDQGRVSSDLNPLTL